MYVTFYIKQVTVDLWDFSAGRTFGSKYERVEEPADSLN